MVLCLYNQFDERIEFYNINGSLVEKINIESIQENEQKSYSFRYYNKRFMIGTEKTKKIIRL